MKLGTFIATALTLILATVAGPALVASANLIIEVEGQLRLRKNGTSQYRLTGVGERLESGDILWPASGAIVKVLCYNSNIWRVPTSIQSGLNYGCPKSPTEPKRKGESYRAGGSDPQIPYTLSPRMTYLLNDQLTFRWNRVKGATRYTVSLCGPVGLEWQTEVSSTEVVYPKEAPSLERGVKYLLTVEADNGKSSLEDGGANLGFELLYNEDTVQEVREKEEKIPKSSDRTDEEKMITLAELYRDKDLIADAIEKLEGLVAQKSKRALVYLRLGDLYGYAGLNLLAETRYSKAIELFKATQERYGLATAQAGLGRVKLMLGKRNEAKQLWHQAISGYKDLGDLERAKELESQLKEAPREREQQGELGPCPVAEILTPRD